MGLLSRLFPARQSNANATRAQGFATFTENAPMFTAWDGTLYDHPLTRAAIEQFARACSKLKPEFVGPRHYKASVRRLFESWPNEMSTWPAFLARCATIYEMDTSVWIVPGLDRNLNIVALYPMKPAYTEIVEYDGEPWCIFHLMNGETMAIEYARCALVSKFQYMSDFFGSGNDALDSTLALLDAQRQAEEQAVKNGARIRFIGRVAGMTHGEDLKKKRELFYQDNLSSANTTGLMMYDNTFDKIDQVKEDRFIIDEEEMARVSKQVFYYFGTNEHILTNDYTEEQWGAWYEGKVEPFAVALSEAMTKMIFSRVERNHGSYVMFSSSKLQYSSNKTKVSVIEKLGGMSLITVNEARDIMQLEPIEGGDVRVARGEFYIMDLENNVIAESGGHGASEPLPAADVDDLDEPE